ncbi:MAG: hypothetical protein ACRD2X_11125, partial [Vicinamibacteraceae bacterium]
IYASVSNGLASNVHFDQEDLGSYGVVFAGGARYAGDDFEVSYEIARHAYTNTSRWDRFSHRLEASFERDLPGGWDFEAVGEVGFKGSSEDRDLVDQDVSITPRLEYRFTPERRLRLFTRHRLKRYTEAPDTNAFKQYFGAEFREELGPGRHWRVGGRLETNDERIDRGDYRRWTYFLEHGVPLTDRSMLVAQLRYRLKRYTQRFVEAEDEDVLRTDHQWIPSVAWVRAINHHVEVRFDYTYETSYSNDPEKEYGSHLAWSSVGVRW